jgi:hypothetical protein
MTVRAPWVAGSRPNIEEELIRTLSVSLIAVAAIAASLIITRESDAHAKRLVPAGENAPVKARLDAIRAAGL